MGESGIVVVMSEELDLLNFDAKNVLEVRQLILPDLPSSKDAQFEVQLVDGRIVRAHDVLLIRGQNVVTYTVYNNTEDVNHFCAFLRK